MDDQIYARLSKLEKFMVEQIDAIKTFTQRISDSEIKNSNLDKNKVDKDFVELLSKEFDQKLVEIKDANFNQTLRLDMSISDLIKSHSDLKNYISENERKINSLNESINQITNQIQHFFAEIDKFVEFKKEIDTKRQYFDTKISEQNTAISKTEEKFDKINEQLKAIDSKFINLNVFDVNLDSMIRDLSKTVNENKLITDTKYNNLSTNTAVKIDEFIKLTNKKIDSLPKSIDPQAIIDEFKTILDSKFNVLSLDVRNCNIRSSNNEEKLIILSKNVEYVQLLLKQLQNQ